MKKGSTEAVKIIMKPFFYMRKVRKLFKPSDSLWFAKILEVCCGMRGKINRKSLRRRAYTRLKGGIKIV